MKNSNYKHNRKFERQVSHMQGFIGMPQWNYRNPSLEEIREYDRRILEEQAKGFKPRRKSLLKLFYSWMMTISSKSFRQIAKARNKTSEITSGLKEPVKTGSECCS